MNKDLYFRLVIIWNILLEKCSNLKLIVTKICTWYSLSPNLFEFREVNFEIKKYLCVM